MNQITKASWIKVAAIGAMAGLMGVIGCAQQPAGQSGSGGVPSYKVDASWPKPLKENWIMGQVAGLHVDSRDHVWVYHRYRGLLADEKGGKAGEAMRCCVAAPPVLEFDPQGNFVRGWGGPGEGYDWPKNEHGIYADAEGYVWVAGNDAADNMILKFTREGKFVMQIGKPGKSEGSNSTTQLGRPANMELDAAANELFVADGYGNKRILVLDSRTGAYKRHWGAYGGTPSDDKMPASSAGSPPSKQFANAVHCVRLSKDGLVYMCDRGNNRVQVFQKNGTYVREFIGTQIGTLDTADLAFSPDAEQRYVVVADGQSSYLRILTRADGKQVGSFARHGRQIGEFRNLHNLGVDSKGNLYTGEAGFGRRIQRFTMQ
jgi:DNA-binding beta-propeller fold protein YncE